MPDEAQPLTAAKPESASAPAAKPAPSTPQAKNDTRGPIRHAPAAPVDKPAEQQPRPKPMPPERERNAPVVRTPAGQPARSGSSNRVRARLARLGVQRANPYNPVLEPLLRIVRSNDPKIETATLRQIERAYQVAERWHRGQKRKSGDPYITHPLAVTTILAELGMDPATLMAGLLHDTVEDTEYGLEDLRRDFGDVVTLLVDGVTKLDKVKFGEAAQAETVRKMVVAMAKDPASWSSSSPTACTTCAPCATSSARSRRRRRARPWRSTRRSPTAWHEHHQVGAGGPRLRDPLPQDVRRDRAPRRRARPKRDEYLAIVTDEVQQDLRAARIKATVTGRPKHYYSVYQKMIVRGRDFAEIYDLVGIRVLVDTVRDCYAALGTVHARWNPVPGRFKDYIAMPKFNMYQSLHTTVIGPNGKPVELQIRTFDMHRRAEYGIAAHWKYKQEAVAGASKVRSDAPKSSGKGKDDHLNDMAWLRQLLDWQKETEDPGEFLESLRFDLSRNEVFVFTPKGDVIALPAGATPWTSPTRSTPRSATGP